MLHITRLFKFGITGLLSLVVSVLGLYILTDLFGVWYIPSAIIAFFPAFFVSFTLQKYWTFNETSPETIRIQLFRHFGIIVVGLMVNVALLAFFVEILHIQYVLAQIFSGMIIALYNFPLYLYVVFRKKK